MPPPASSPFNALSSTPTLQRLNEIFWARLRLYDTAPASQGTPAAAAQPSSKRSDERQRREESITTQEDDTVVTEKQSKSAAGKRARLSSVVSASDLARPPRPKRARFAPPQAANPKVDVTPAAGFATTTPSNTQDKPDHGGASKNRATTITQSRGSGVNGAVAIDSIAAAAGPSSNPPSNPAVIPQAAKSLPKSAPQQPRRAAPPKVVRKTRSRTRRKPSSPSSSTSATTPADEPVEEWQPITFPNAYSPAHMTDPRQAWAALFPGEELGYDDWREKIVRKEGVWQVRTAADGPYVPQLLGWEGKAQERRRVAAEKRKQAVREALEMISTAEILVKMSAEKVEVVDNDEEVRREVIAATAALA